MALYYIILHDVNMFKHACTSILYIYIILCLLYVYVYIQTMFFLYILYIQYIVICIHLHIYMHMVFNDDSKLFSVARSPNSRIFGKKISRGSPGFERRTVPQQRAGLSSESGVNIQKMWNTHGFPMNIISHFFGFWKYIYEYIGGYKWFHFFCNYGYICIYMTLIGL